VKDEKTRKCSGLACSVYDFLKMLVETDLNDAKDGKGVEEKKPRVVVEASRKFSEELRRFLDDVKRREAEKVGEKLRSTRSTMAMRQRK
jgi:hypothetical protein